MALAHGFRDCLEHVILLGLLRNPMDVYHPGQRSVRLRISRGGTNTDLELVDPKLDLAIVGAHTKDLRRGKGHREDPW